MTLWENLNKYLNKEIINKIKNSLEDERTYCLLINDKKTNFEFLKSVFPTLEKHPFIKNACYYDGRVDFPGKSYLFDNGAYYIIDASSLLVSYFLSINENELFLDMCAAPGGKSISQFLKSEKIYGICNDLSKNRAFLMSENFERLGIANAIITNNDLSKVYKNYPSTFDKIILDAPCSGSGMIRKNDAFLSERTFEKVKRCVAIQKELLEIAYYLVKFNGIISYSTCSLSYEENEEIILDFIHAHPDCEILNLPSITGEYRSKELPQAIHLFPGLYQGEGLFICQLRKKQDNFFSIKKKKETKKTIINKFNLPFIYEIEKNCNFYANSIALDTKYFNVLKEGLHIGEQKKDIFIPSFHLAHFLDSEKSISLNDSEAKLYLHGDIINYDLKLKDGFYIVSYNNINLGYVKKIGKILKNYYPKGLRH